MGPKCRKHVYLCEVWKFMLAHLESFEEVLLQSCISDVCQVS